MHSFSWSGWCVILGFGIATLNPAGRFAGCFAALQAANFTCHVAFCIMHSFSWSGWCVILGFGIATLNPAGRFAGCFAALQAANFTCHVAFCIGELF